MDGAPSNGAEGEVMGNECCILDDLCSGSPACAPGFCAAQAYSEAIEKSELLGRIEALEKQVADLLSRPYLTVDHEQTTG